MSRKKSEPDVGFIDRMRAISTIVGNNNVLSRLSGVSQSTLANYFTGGEPGRVHLSSLAKAAQVSIRWLSTGEGPMKPEEYHPQPVTLKAPETGQVAGEKFTAAAKADLMEMTSEVLDSETVYRQALASNIKAFHHGVIGEERLKSTDEKMDLMMKRMESMEKTLMAFMSGTVEAEKKRVGESN